MAFDLLVDLAENEGENNPELALGAKVVSLDRWRAEYVATRQNVARNVAKERPNDVPPGRRHFGDIRQGPDFRRICLGFVEATCRRHFGDMSSGPRGGIGDISLRRCRMSPSRWGFGEK